MVGPMLALALLIAMGALGVGALRRSRLGLEPVEEVAFGVPLGAVVGSLAVLLAAIAIGLERAVPVVGIGCTISAAALWRGRPRGASTTVEFVPNFPTRSDSVGTADRLFEAATIARLIRAAQHYVGTDHWRPWPVAVIGGFTLLWSILWRNALIFDAEGLWAGHVHIWGDWAQHIGDVASFVYGENFPPQHPRFAGQPYGYHYLPALTAAAMVQLGLSPTAALSLHSFVFLVFIAIGMYAFGWRLTRHHGAAALAVMLFLLGSGLDWDPIRQYVDNLEWHNIYFAQLQPRRGYLYGLPLGMLVLTLLLRATQGAARRAFLVAGIVAGLLPLAHLGTLLALALVVPALFVLSPGALWRPLPSRPWLILPAPGWLLFVAITGAVAAPQLLLANGGGPAAVSGVRLQLGWMAAPDPWPWFWLKNLGLFLPLLGMALAIPRVVPVPGRRLLWAMMPIFAVTNLAVFQPDAWDNSGLITFWFLAVCVLVAALLARAWREQGTLLGRCLVVGLVAILVVGGVQLNLRQLLGHDRHLLLTSEELHLAAAVRDRTPPDAVFAVGLQHNHPIPLLSGRRVVMGYPGWLWPRGYDYGQREQDLRAIYDLAPGTRKLLATYGVDYVVVGPWERQEFAPKERRFRKRYPLVISTDNYNVFDVRPGAESMRGCWPSPLRFSALPSQLRVMIEPQAADGRHATERSDSLANHCQQGLASERVLKPVPITCSCRAAATPVDENGRSRK